MGRRFLLTMSLIAVASAQSPTPTDVSPYISVHAPVLVLNHVRVIDGTGAAAKENQSVVIADGKIQAVGPFGTVEAPANAEQLDRTGYTVIPGLVGMHDHLYYTDSISVQRGADGKISRAGTGHDADVPYTAPRLYLAAGVTTLRTTGSVEPYTDLKVKQRIDAEPDARPEDRC